MYSTRKIAEQIADKFHAPGTMHFEMIASAVDAALQHREQEVRERCAKTADIKAAEWRRRAGMLRTEKGRAGAVAMAVGADEIAAAIRRDDTPQEGEQSK